MKRGAISLLLLALASATLSLSAIQRKLVPVIREESHINIQNIREVWRLEWKQQPTPFCMPDTADEAWLSCPCDGFAFGEAGQLELVRFRNNRAIDRLSLSGFFVDYDNAVLPRWELRRADVD